MVCCSQFYAELDDDIISGIEAFIRMPCFNPNRQLIVRSLGFFKREKQPAAVKKNKTKDGEDWTVALFEVCNDAVDRQQNKDKDRPGRGRDPLGDDDLVELISIGRKINNTTTVVRWLLESKADLLLEDQDDVIAFNTLHQWVSIEMTSMAEHALFSTYLHETLVCAARVLVLLFLCPVVLVVCCLLVVCRSLTLRALIVFHVCCAGGAEARAGQRRRP